MHKDDRRKNLKGIKENSITFTNLWSSQSNVWREEDTIISVLSEFSRSGLEASCGPCWFPLSFTTKAMATFPLDMRSSPFSCKWRCVPSLSLLAEETRHFSDISRVLVVSLALRALIISVTFHLNKEVRQKFNNHINQWQVHLAVEQTSYSVTSHSYIYNIHFFHIRFLMIETEIHFILC